MLIKCLTVGHIQSNCYIVTDEDTLECAVIDPGAESNTILSYLEKNNLKCKYIFLTHGHFDHTGAVNELMSHTGCTLCVSKKDTARLPHEMLYKFKAPSNNVTLISDGDSFEVGSLRFEVMATPGHSEGGMTFRCGEALFTGDTLFRDSCGRTDLPGCNAGEMMRSLKKLAELPGDYEVYPGHMESTSLERERRFNYFMQSATQG